MKKLLVAVCLTLAATLGIALVGPYLIDWNRYKPELAAAAMDRFGLAIAIDGNVDIDILPQPRITMNLLTVQGNGGNGDTPPAATMRWARVEFGLHGFLMGTPQLTRIEVVEPEITAPLFVAARIAEGSEAGRAEAVATVEAARLAVPNALQARLGATIDIPYLGVRYDTDAGAWRFDGQLAPGGSGPIPVTGTARARTGGGARLEATLRQPDRFDVKLSGAVMPAGTSAGEMLQAYEFRGRINAAFDAIDAVGGELTFNGPVAISADGDLSVDPLTVEIPAGHAEGRLQATINGTPSVHVDLSAALMDFDSDGAGTASQRSPFAIASTVLDATGNMAVSIRLSTDRARWRGGLLSDIEFTATSEGPDTRNVELEARLPGDVIMSTAGTLEVSDHGPRYVGPATLSGNSLREFSIWAVPALTDGFDNIPRDRLRQVALAATVDLSHGSIGLKDVAGEVDGDPVHGALMVRAPHSDNPGELNLSVALSSLHLSPTGGGPSQSNKPDGSESARSMAAVLAGYLTAIDVAIENVVLSGSRVGGGRVDLRMDPVTPSGSLTAQIKGPGDLYADAQGSIAMVKGAPRINADISIRAPNPVRTAIELGADPDLEEFARRTGPFTASLGVDGDAASGKAHLALDGKHADLRLEGAAGLVQRDGETALQIQINAGESRFADLPMRHIAAQLALTTEPHLRVDHFTATLADGSADISLSGDIAQRDGNYRMNADVAVENIDLRKTVGRLGDLVSVSGSGWFGGKFTATAATPLGLLDEITGSGRLDGRAVLKGTSGGGGALKLQQFRRLRAWLDKHFGGTGAKLSGSLSLASGDLAIRDLVLSAKGAAGYGRAVMDLNENTIEGRFEADDRKGKKPYLILDFSNRLDSPDVHASGEWVSGR